MKKRLSVITALAVVIHIAASMSFAFSASANNGDPWENNIIHVTSSADNFVTPPGIAGSGHANYTTSGGGYSFTEGKYTASTSALPAGYTLFSIMKTDLDKVPLIVDPDQEYTISFDWKNLYNGPAPDAGAGQTYNGQVELRAYGVASGEIFRDTFLAAGARTAGQSGKISKTVNFSAKDPSWLGGGTPPTAGDDVYLYIYGANVQGFEISNFIITNKDYDPWESDMINVTSESYNFVTPPTDWYPWVGYPFPYVNYNWEPGKYTASEIGTRKAGTYQSPQTVILQTNPVSVPLTFDKEDDKYTFTFDWKITGLGGVWVHLFQIIPPTSGSPVKENITQLGSDGSRSGTTTFTVAQADIPAAYRAVKDIRLYFSGVSANVTGFEISNFTITNKDYDPWENDIIDVTSEGYNFVTPPTDWYPGVGYPFPYVNYNWEPGKYTASEIGARKAGTYQSPQTVILQTNPVSVPLTFDKEDDKYTFTFDWKITGLGGVWVHLFQITSPTAGNQVKALITQLGGDGSRSGTTTFTVTQADIPAAYRAVKDIRLYFSGVSDKVTGFEISNFTVANKDYIEPPSAPRLAGKTAFKVTLEEESYSGYTVEYGIKQDESISWQSNPVFEGLAPETEYHFYVKKIKGASDFALSAPTVIITFSYAEYKEILVDLLLKKPVQKTGFNPSIDGDVDIIDLLDLEQRINNA